MCTSTDQKTIVFYNSQRADVYVYFFPSRRLGPVVHVSLVSETDVIAGSRKPGSRPGSETGHDVECERTFISIRARRSAKRIRES